jgi:hypothetical protein
MAQKRFGAREGEVVAGPIFQWRKKQPFCCLGRNERFGERSLLFLDSCRRLRKPWGTPYRWTMCIAFSIDTVGESLVRGLAMFRQTERHKPSLKKIPLPR